MEKTMKILIVTAQEEKESFGRALATTAENLFKENGHEVKTSHLYDMKFNPIASAHDFTKRENASYIQYMLEQKHASTIKGFSNDILQEQKKILWADLIIIHTPLWWFSVPAILKGWFDRVFATGVTWDFDAIYDKGLLKGKRGMLVLTTGGPHEIYAKDKPHKASIEEITHSINHGIFKFNGMEALPMFIAWSTFQAGDEGRKKYLSEYKKQIQKLC